MSVTLFLIILAISVALSARLHARVARLEREMTQLRSGTTPLESTGPRLVGEAEPDMTLGGLFERVFGGRLLIWIGGIALAAGGIFLIRHSIQLVTPEARMIAAALLGLALIGAGEYARAGRLLSHDERIGQALVGAGIAVLYATAYGSYLLFGLIGAGMAAALMVVITAGALGLSLRHGAPTAAIGLVGGFLTPLLVGDEQAGALPVLAYLALLDIAIFAIAWRRGRAWLIAAALAASFAWTGAFIMGSAEDALPAGAFAALLGLAGALPASERAKRWTPVPPAVALAELALMVGRSDLDGPAWLLFGLTTIAGLALAARRPEHRVLPPIALVLALLLIAAKAGIDVDPALPWAALATTLLLGATALVVSGRGTVAALTSCGALAGPLLILRALQADLLGRAGYGVAAFLLAIAALGLLAWLRRQAGTSAGRHIAAGTAALLLAVGAHDLLPANLVSAAWLVLSTGLLLAGIRLGEAALRVAGLALLAATVFKVFLVDAAELEGVLRILSFLGLGIALIGIGLLYGKILAPKVKPTPS